MKRLVCIIGVLLFVADTFADNWNNRTVFTDGMVVNDTVQVSGNCTIPVGVTVVVNGPFSVQSSKTLTINGTLVVNGTSCTNFGTINITTINPDVATVFASLTCENMENAESGKVYLNSGYLKTRKDLNLEVGSEINFASGKSGVLVYNDLNQKGRKILNTIYDGGKITPTNGLSGTDSIMVVVAGTYNDYTDRDYHPWRGKSGEIVTESNVILAVNSYNYDGVNLWIFDRFFIDIDKYKNEGFRKEDVEVLKNNINSTLPIVLTYFIVQNDGNSVVFEWQTESEQNNDYFTIEVSNNAVEYNEVAVVAGAGTSTIVNNYQYTDYTQYYGTVYFRLKQTDYNGNYTYSEAQPFVFAEELKYNTMPNIVVYPNPATDYIVIEGVNVEKVRFIDAMGRTVACESNQVEYNVSQLPKGINIVVITANGQEYIERFIKK